MAKSIQCPCGFVIEAPDDDRVVADAQRHAREAHGMDLSREQAIAMIRPSVARKDG